MQTHSTIYDVVRSARWLIVAAIVLMLAFSAAGTALAQGEQPPDIQAVADSASDTATSLNVLWVLIAGALVFFMQAGFALVETGFTRNKNVVHTMMMNMMVFCIGALGYWLVGFALIFRAVVKAMHARHHCDQANGKHLSIVVAASGRTVAPTLGRRRSARLRVGWSARGADGDGLVGQYDS